MTTPQNHPAGQTRPHQHGPHYPAYPAQPGAPAPGLPAQPPAPKSRKKWPWILGGVVVLIALIAAVSGGGDPSPAGDAGSGATVAADDAESRAAGLNTPVRDGKFEFVVTGVESGVSEVGDNEFLTEKAQGQFVIVTMTVKNIGDKSQSFSPSEQKLKDTDGRTFETDSSAQIALGGTDIAVWDKVNPGNTVTVKLVYDMPSGAKPATLELHDSMFSGGVTVDLR
ncbi:DUF4352 domain-containing protein [Gordonia iterans]